jgi:CRP-like cAMP-binding protein
LIHPELFNTVIEQQSQKIKQLQSSIEKLKKRDIVGKVARLFKNKTQRNV